VKRLFAYSIRYEGTPIHTGHTCAEDAHNATVNAIAHYRDLHCPEALSDLASLGMVGARMAMDMGLAPDIDDCSVIVERKVMSC
jgi:hypothetical protein